MALWSEGCERSFFNYALKGSTPSKIFYSIDNSFYAYIPKAFAKNKTGAVNVVQGRNTLIGEFTEKWCKSLLEPIAKKHGLYAVQKVECSEIALQKKSEADIAFCTTPDRKQESTNIKLIVEVKMAVLSNWKYCNNTLSYVGDYTTHIGCPSLLRSDSVLKAIGKAINIRTSSVAASGIPIIVIGNSPLPESYIRKVDHLKTYGVIQTFLSLNPNIDYGKYKRRSPKLAFNTIENIKMLEATIDSLLINKLNYFSSMTTNEALASYILAASREKTATKIANKFLTLIREGKEIANE